MFIFSLLSIQSGKRFNFYVEKGSCPFIFIEDELLSKLRGYSSTLFVLVTSSSRIQYSPNTDKYWKIVLCIPISTSHLFLVVLVAILISIH